MLNYTKDIYPINNQIKRIFCAYHDKQFLTNFCQQKQCLMPLCPSCIAQHTQQHFQQGKKPSYININQALNKAKQSCYCTIITMQQYKKLNQNVFHYISNLQTSIHIQLQQKRNHIFDLITGVFIDFQARLIKQIKDSYLQKNVYSIQESLNASKYIDEEISNLYQKISLLKGDDCLSSLITYYAVDQENYKEALVEFDQYFQKNRKAGKLEISILEDNLNKIVSNFCDNVLSVQSIVQNFEPKVEEQMIQNDSLKSKRYGFSKMNQKSLQKQQQPKRRTIFDKQNQQGNNNRSSPKKFQKPQNLVINSKQQKNSANDISFNGDNQKVRSNQSIHTKSIKQLSKHNSRRSEQYNSFAQNSHNSQNYQSKRFTRQFKKIN